MRTDIPADTYWCEAKRCFFRAVYNGLAKDLSLERLGHDFLKLWRDRRDEFPRILCPD